MPTGVVSDVVRSVGSDKYRVSTYVVDTSKP